MSFILEDKNLINHLLKVAQEAAPKPAVTPQTISGYEAATKLLYKLQSDLGDDTAPKATAPISSESPLSGEDSDLKVANLRTLGDFINWLADKRITWDGKRIAWTPAEHDANPRDPDISKAWQFTSLPFDRDDRNELDRKPITTEAYATKDSLVSYLSYLRDSKEAKENNVFKFMIGSLIGELNGFLRTKGDNPIATKPTAAGPTSAIDPKLVIDVVPAVLDPSNPLQGIEAHPFLENTDQNNWLQYSDIMSSGAFFNWLRSRKVKVKKGNTTVDVNVLDPDGDQCAAIYVLYKRALFLNGPATKGDDVKVPNYTKAAAEYLKNIQVYGKELKTPDGKACDVTSPTGGGGTSSGGGAGAGGAGGGAGGAGDRERRGRPDQDAIALYAEIVSAFPLDTAGVSFDRIAHFCTVIQKLNYGPWNQIAVQTADYIRKAQGTLSTTKPTTLRDGIELNVHWARSPKGYYIIPFANNFDDQGMFCHYIEFVKSIVDNVMSLISSFLTKYKNDLYPAQYSVGVSQVGSGASRSGSIYAYNIESITNYMTQANCFI